MKSNRQRRTEIMQRRKEKQVIVQAKTLSTSYDTPTDRQLGRTRQTMPVNPANLRPTNSYGVPEFVKRGFYVDMPFTCKQCGTPQIWTAQQQHWWYELANGDVWTIAVLCRPCRIQERERKALAKKLHVEGLLKKLQVSNQSATLS